MAFINDVANTDFWVVLRHVQATRMNDVKRQYGFIKADIAVVLDVSRNIVSRWTTQARRLPPETRPRSGRPSEVEPSFQDIKAFLKAERRANRAVTMGVLLAHVTDVLKVTVSNKTLLRYMKQHGFLYEMAETRDT